MINARRSLLKSTRLAESTMLFLALLMYPARLAPASIPVSGQAAFFSVSVKADNTNYLTGGFSREADVF
ncbi:hypothetical protein WKI40_11570 [Kosakonia sacchari]|uniref:hypothetical protein n=1 Tax=Kosakonia sacchari TaxID=1158459 RepID=UPI0030C5F15D